jgi:2',3'-cyclic-nucleotide 2'-phosphodiesterase (5'-nucleotidase family)
MKKTIIFISIILLFTLTACTVDNSLNSSTTTLQTTNSTFDSSSSTQSETTTVPTIETTSNTTISTTQNSTISTIESSTESTTNSTTEVENRYQDLYFYSVNDFHGGSYLNFSSFSNIIGKINEVRESETNVFALANGDILQGTAISNYYHGEPLMEAMNYGNFDGFVIGNHEFDWGIDVISQYKDRSTENIEANYPILAANIVYEDTQEPLEFTNPYIIKETSGVKVGIIGLIGEVMDSISASRVENIEFLDPVDTVSYYANHLRTEEAVDLVIVYIHNSSDINYSLANLSGNAKVDAIFNGHTHWNEAGSIDRDFGAPLYYAQASSNYKSLLAEIKITYDSYTNTITYGNSKTYSYDELSYYSSSEVNLLFEGYMENPVYTEYTSQVLATSYSTYDRPDLAPWGASVIRDYLKIDIGAVNGGGFRIPMESGIITMGEMITIYPFDNFIKTSALTGQQINDYYYYALSEDVYFDDKLKMIGGYLYLDGELIIDDEYYIVGAVDYIFDKPDLPFLYGLDIDNTGYLMRDLLVQDLLNQTEDFKPSNGTSYEDTQDIFWAYAEINQMIV